MSLNTLTESLVKDILSNETKKTQLLAFNKLDELKLTKNTQPAIMTIGVSIFTLSENEPSLYLK